MRVKMISYSNQSSAGFGEAYDFSEVAEALPAEEQVVLADEADLVLAPAALAAVFAEFTGVGPPEQVGHVVKLNINILYKTTYISLIALSHATLPSPTDPLPPSSASAAPLSFRSFPDPPVAVGPAVAAATYYNSKLLQRCSVLWPGAFSGDTEPDADELSPLLVGIG